MGLNVKLIRESFNAVKPHAQEFVEHFYEELFSRYPQAKGLFTQVNMTSQQKALIGSLVYVVDNLENADKLTQYLQKMGGRHVNYGTENEHYAWVGESLLATFEYFFDTNWTAELNEQWGMAYGFITNEMQKGAASVTSIKNHNKQENKKPVKQEPTLEELTREVARQMFKKAIDDELSSQEFQNALKEKAKTLLRKSLEEEAQRMLGTLKKAA